MGRRAMAGLACSVALTTLASSLEAQVGLASPLDIVEQDIAVDLTLDGTTITVDAVVRTHFDAVALHVADTALPVTGVWVDGKPASIAPHPSDPAIQRIVLADPLPAGRLATVRVLMDGDTMVCEGMDNPGVLGCLRTDGETVFTPTFAGHTWHLKNPYASDGFTGSVTVRAPADQHVVAGQGSAESVAYSGGDTRTWTFRYDQPTDMLGLYAGRATLISRSSPFPVDSVVSSPDARLDRVEDASEVASELVPLLAEFLGDVPFDTARIVIVPSEFPFRGMGLVGTVFLNETVIGEHDYALEQDVAHEFAHSWWGGVASAEHEAESFVIHEAFAEYSAWRALGVLHGDDARTAGSRMNAVWYMYRRPTDHDVAPLSAEPSDPAYVFAVYHKASTALRAVEEAAGEDAFTRALRRLLGGGFGSVTIEGFVAALEEESGDDLSHVVDQWLREPGFPVLTVSTEIAESSRGTELALSIDTAGAFAMQVPLTFVYPDGRRDDAAVQVTEGTTTHRFDLAERPTRVELDPRWTLVREVRPSAVGDVTLDGDVDGADLIEVALHTGGFVPEERRRDGAYDPIYDVNHSKVIDDHDLRALTGAP